MKPSNPKTLMLLLALNGAVAAAPGQAAAGTLQLSLADAVRLALSEGAAVRIAALKVQESQAARGQARSALLPQLDAQASAASNMLNMNTMGLSLHGLGPIIGPYGLYDTHVAAAMSVVDLAALRRYRAAQQGLKLSEAERRQAAFEVAATVSQLYVSVQRADAAVGASESTVELFGRLRDLASDRWQAGVATRLDSLRAEVQLTRERQNLLAALSQRDHARLALLRVIGADLAQEVFLTDSLSGAPRDVPALEVALAAARRDRPELVEADAAMRAAELAVAAVSAEYLPTLGVQVKGGYDGSALDEVHMLAAAVSVPLWNGGRTAARLDAARARQRQAGIRRAETERQVEQEVRRALTGHASAAGRVALAEQNLRLAEQELEVATDRFAHGVSTNVEVDNAQSSLSAARQGHVAALADEAQTWHELARSTGRVLQLVPAEGR
jgi:multidrug efflux system outer membrane protein